MITAVGLTKAFGGRPVVEDVTFTVAPGEVVGLLGPNGAGKTTTMRMLLGLLRPDSGHASVEGEVGWLPEVFAAYESRSVEGYLRFCARMRRLDPDTVVVPALVVAAATELARRPIGRLSKGQRQRVGWAQAVLGAPGNLVLDEPTLGLDPSQVDSARRLVRDLAGEGTAVLVSTHLLHEAASMCDRVVILIDGAVASDERPGATGDLEARFLHLIAGAQ